MRTIEVTSGWTLAVGATAALVIAAILPSVLEDPLSGLIHHGFSSLCHQLPERSPHLAGAPIALCHRCFGMLVGLFVGILVGPLLPKMLSVIPTNRQGLWLLLALMPAGIDWTLGATGVWMNTPSSRMITGAIFGGVAGWILAANLLHTLVPTRSPTRVHAV